MQVRCPLCTQVVSVAAGGVQPCPSCGQTINVPGAPSASPMPPVSPVSSQLPIQGALCAQHPGEPATVTCQRCGNFACARCLDYRNFTKCRNCRQISGEGNYEPTPWEKRQEIGVVTGFFKTWTQSLFNPVEFWSKTNPKGSTWDALSWAWICLALGGLGSLPIILVELSVIEDPEFGKLANELNLSSELLWGGIVGLFILAMLLIPLGLFISAAFIHLGCMMTGSSKNGFEATLRSVCYASGPQIVSGIPCINAVGGIYHFVLQVMGVGKLQQTSVGKSIFAVLWWLLLIPCLALPLVIIAVSFSKV